MSAQRPRPDGDALLRYGGPPIVPVRIPHALRPTAADAPRSLRPPAGPDRARTAELGRSSGPQGRLSVVVADDNAAFRTGIVRALRRCADVDVVAEAPDGTAALLAARTHRPDVVVLDDRMPGLGGCEVAAAVVADAALEGVRVVLLTARADPGMAVEAAASGAVACLDKAWSRRDICRAIRVAAGRSGAD